MLEHLDGLYREVILDHFKNPSHSGTLADAQITAEGNNPLCGDDLTFYLKLKADGSTDDCLAKIRFTGTGCAIIQAAASILADGIP